MAVSNRELAERLERVEKELAELKASLGAKSRKPWYHEVVGSFANDEALAEIARLGRLIRRGKIKNEVAPVPVLLDTDHLSVLQWSEQPAVLTYWHASTAFRPMTSR
jgi:hypothetical protein